MHPPQELADKGSPVAGTNPFFIAASLMMSVVGPGLLCIPFAFSLAGIVSAEILLCVVAGAACFTAELLLVAHDITGCVSYDSLAACAFGEGSLAHRLVPLTNFLGIFGACTGYMRIVITLLPLLGFLPFSFNQTGWWTAASASPLLAAALFTVLVLPVCLLRDVSDAGVSCLLSLHCLL
jgi:amino acid permease